METVRTTVLAEVLREMRSDTSSKSESVPDDAAGCGGGGLPTTPCSVVWSGGHPFVLEGSGGRSRWVGVDDRGRPRFLSDAELNRRGWSLPLH
ncbi:hypothetical protein SAMN04487820_11320 [Actinopolyspora mzabensis]|uniref:Uncharacterized protein n=1 Tax=Actinopolyspora mzabensis TaxID=995066 RepID=A0A1G9EUS1_ACTMZ|nr:hypothetical protein SAMN04487820_11320 [Actinopolyspora mzabensis]